MSRCVGKPQVDEDRNVVESALERAPALDPLAALPEGAREILYAAQRIIAEKGLNAVTFARLANESGKNAALISYYFGNKKGLLECVVESILHDECLEVANGVRGLSDEPRVGSLISQLKKLAEAREPYVAFFELLVHSLRHDATRQRMVDMYRWYISINEEMLEVDKAQDAESRRLLRGVAKLLCAVGDGLAIQALIDPEVFALEEPFDALEVLLAQVLPELLAAREDQGEPADHPAGAALPKEIIAKLRQADALLSEGETIPEIVKALHIHELTYYRWRNDYTGLNVSQANRLEDLERENARLRRAVADLTLDKLILEEAAQGTSEPLSSKPLRRGSQ